MHLKHPKFREGLLILCLGLILGIYSVCSFRTAVVQTSWIMSPYLFPLFLSVLTVLISLSLLWEGMRECGTEHASHRPKVKQTGIVLLLCILYAALLPHLSFLPATILFLAVLIRYLGEKRLRIVVPVAVFTPLLLYLIFAVGLSVRLP